MSRPVAPAEFDSDETVPLGCPKCNAPMKPNDDLCDECGYHLILKKVIDISDMKKPNRGTGFERVLHDQLAEGESAQNTLLLMKIVASVLMLACLFLCLGRWWWVGVLAVAAAVAYYWMNRQRRGASGSADSAVNADPVSELLWSLLLTAQRIAGWRRSEWPFPKAKALTLNDPNLTDDELRDLDGLSEVEALDLEGSGVTDEGLAHLQGLRALRFLVLRRTQVTRSGVVRLQEKLPRVHIWHD